MDEFNSRLEITKQILTFMTNKQKLYSLKKRKRWIENNEQGLRNLWGNIKRSNTEFLDFVKKRKEKMRPPKNNLKE